MQCYNMLKARRVKFEGAGDAHFLHSPFERSTKRRSIDPSKRTSTTVALLLVLSRSIKAWLILNSGHNYVPVVRLNTKITHADISRVWSALWSAQLEMAVGA